MNCYVKVNLITGFMWSYIIIIWLFIGEDIMELSFGLKLIISLAPSVVTGFVTFLVMKKTQIKENTEEIRELRESMGIDKDETLQHQITSRFVSVANDIGRGDEASLTKQHQKIESCIEKNFKIIQQRYDEEDDIYRKFNSQQYDIKQVLDNFSRDYTEQIRLRSELEKKNQELLQKVTELEEELLMYRTKEEMYNGYEIGDDGMEM